MCSSLSCPTCLEIFIKCGNENFFSWLLADIQYFQMISRAVIIGTGSLAFLCYSNRTEGEINYLGIHDDA